MVLFQPVHGQVKSPRDREEVPCLSPMLEVLVFEDVVPKEDLIGDIGVEGEPSLINARFELTVSVPREGCAKPKAIPGAWAIIPILPNSVATAPP